MIQNNNVECSWMVYRHDEFAMNSTIASCLGETDVVAGIQSPCVCGRHCDGDQEVDSGM